MLGRFSEESLRAFAESHNLNTGNQDFSEGIFDFKVCQKPDGKHYGIPNQDKCKSPAKEVKAEAGAKRNKAIEDFKRLNEQLGYDYARTRLIQRYKFDYLNESGILDEIKKFEGKAEKKEREDKDKSIGDFYKKREEKSKNKDSKGAVSELSSESGVKGGAALGALEELEGLRNKVVAKFLDRNKTGPEVSRQVKARFEPEVRQMMQNVGASASDTENAIRYVNKGIDANLNFSEESLRAFAEFHNLNTGNQDFSEGIFDFKVCQKPDGKNYGIPDQDKCKAPAKEVKAAAAPKKKVYSAEDTEYMYKKYMTMAKNEGQGSMDASSSAGRMLEAAGMDRMAMDGMARKRVREEVFGK